MHWQGISGFGHGLPYLKDTNTLKPKTTEATGHIAIIYINAYVDKLSDKW